MTQYVGIRSEGGLIPYDVLDKIGAEESGLGQQPKDFGLTVGRRLTDEIARAWSDAQDYWHIFQRRTASLPESETGTTLTRKWIGDLLNEQLLGYELTYQPSGAVIGGKNYPISHRAGSGEESPPIQIEGFRTDLDRRPEGRRLSPQALVQEYLNNSDGHLWGIVTNGFLLRLLRDTSRTSRPSYLEFDLQSILDGNRFNEFALFYRVCHRTRLPRTAEDSTSCWLEKYFQLSIEQGGRVRDKLRDGVEDALKTLGTGFLRHPRNEALRERVKAGTLTAAEFHRQLLRLVYRLLFLMVAEERRMIVPEAPDSERRQRLYGTYYSVGRLRTLAEKVIERSTFGDLWLSLQRTFALFENGDSNPLGIPPLNGDLFSTLSVRDLQDTHLYNDHLLEAIRRLSLFEEKRVLQRVNYGALDVEELGSVYESLLDFQPVFLDEPEGKEFDLRTGSERKSTGSYYTRPELVRELIESALVPVMQDRLSNAKDSDSAKDKEKKQQVILAMSICDPACGSGHFLLAAARRLGRELAKVRTGEEEPTPKDFHLAVRDVISHCVYGVDVNPLAVDLCKLALWLEGHWTGKPLSFLDHRIKCGNSLIGVLDPSVLKEGIPDDAFTPVAGDDKKVANAFKKENKEERKGQPSLPFDAAEHVHKFAAESVQLVGIAEDTPADVRRKEEIYRRARAQRDWLRDWTAANLWTAAFFVPLTKYDSPEVPTHRAFMDYLVHEKDRPQMSGYANALSVERHFFHWRLEFSDVFDKGGGFDVVLGNPPWEKIQLEEDKFFALIAPDIAELPAKQRKAAIQRLETERPKLHTAFQNAIRQTAAQAKFVKNGTRFPLSAEGNVSTQSLFIELACTISGPHSRIGLVVPSGLATQDTQKRLFSELTGSGRLIRLLDFENRLKLFPSVHAQFRFCIVTIGPRRPRGAEMEFAFLLQSTDDIRKPKRSFRLTNADLLRFSPNTMSCPQLVNEKEAFLLRHIYTTGKVIYREDTHENPWGWQSWQVFNETHEADLLIENADGKDVLPLYEGKLFYQFDHRYASYVTPAEALHLSSSDKQRPELNVRTRYFVPRRVWAERVAVNHYDAGWILAFRRITNSTNERTSIFCILPKCITGSQSPAVKTNQKAALVASLLSNLNSTVFDFAARRKVGGTDLNHFIIHQLPVMTPLRLSQKAPFGGKDQTVSEWIVPRVLELSYTACDLQPFAHDCGWNAPPFRWDDERRFLLRCELDAAFFHMYLPAGDDGDWKLLEGQSPDDLRLLKASFPTPRDAAAYIMDTFPITRHKEEENYGEYRSKRVVLDIYDRMQGAISTGAPYQTPDRAGHG